ncbi:MAG: pantoate--beta-alanine ligase [Ignavibacteriales bacterium]|nr:pantoate--beta-alanine ligase [Ignavibacteriales bacterium]
MLKVIYDLNEWVEIRKEAIRENKLIGFVPTMGALHLGHRALIERSRRENDIVVVSIFVNPTQFNDANDLKKYPKTYDDDLEMLQECNVDYLIFPNYENMYPDNYHYKIIEDDFSTKLCGASRPGHFDGVLTVVMKLLNIIKPTCAYFGEKDYQQYKLIAGMVKAFFMDVEIVPCKTVRAEGGLALSSRNKLLTKDELKIAPLFNKFLSSNLSIPEIKMELEKNGFKIDYIEEINNRRFGAVFLGKVRLIDNVEI